MGNICRNCGKEAVLDPKLGLGPMCLKKHGIDIESRKPKKEIVLKIKQRDFSEIDNTVVKHEAAKSVPLDLLIHSALELEGYDDFDRDKAEERFNFAVKSFFSGDKVPNSFKEKLDEIGFKVEGYLPRMKSSPVNFTNLIVTTEGADRLMILRVNANYEHNIIYFKSVPQYAFLNQDNTDLLISLREEFQIDKTDSALEFDFFIQKIGKPPREEYLNNFPEWIKESCTTGNHDNWQNIYNKANSTSASGRGELQIKEHRKNLTKDQFATSFYLKPESEINPIRRDICRVVGKDKDLTDIDTLARAVYEVDIRTYDVYSSRLGQSISYSVAYETFTGDERMIKQHLPESDSNNPLTRAAETAQSILREKGYDAEKSFDLITKLMDYYGVKT